MTTYNLTLNLKKEAYGETIINYFNNNVENFTNLHFYQYGGIDTDTTDNRFYDMAFDYVTVTIKTKKSIDFLLNFFESIEINSKNEEVEILETYNSQNEELENVEFSNEIIYMDEEEEEEFEAKDLLEFNALLNAKDLKPDTSEDLKPGEYEGDLFSMNIEFYAPRNKRAEWIIDEVACNPIYKKYEFVCAPKEKKIIVENLTEEGFNEIIKLRWFKNLKYQWIK